MTDKREKDRAEKRSQAKEGVRVWSSGLSGHMTVLKEFARREWNFENFHMRVKQVAPYVSREELREFIQVHGIQLRDKPKPSGRVV